MDRRNKKSMYFIWQILKCYIQHSQCVLDTIAVSPLVLIVLMILFGRGERAILACNYFNIILTTCNQVQKWIPSKKKSDIKLRAKKFPLAQIPLQAEFSGKKRIIAYDTCHPQPRSKA